MMSLRAVGKQSQVTFKDEIATSASPALRAGASVGFLAMTE
jgi:hypothetical protein